MSETTTRELKLIQYLNEAYGKEKELETALQAHIKLTTRPPYKKRLQEHLKETKAQARALEKRIKQLGGKAELGTVAQVTDAAASVANKGVSLAKGQFHALRGTGEAEKMLKNAKTEYFNEHEEIATYIGIETLAEALGDTETAKLAREHRRQEERMAAFLEKQIPVLTKAVVSEEIPARERKPAPAASTPARRPAARTRGGASASSRTVKSRVRSKA
jgi:ferritin-like metal-binding protein YciE